jgi:nucleoside-diphosphate-sugar epimerase
VTSKGRILVTGDQGYIGTVLVGELMDRGYAVAGLDTGYFADCLLGPGPRPYPRFTLDLRDIAAEHVKDIDGIIHLAALSNDPVGELAPTLTDEINRDATVRLATLAKNAGVRRFVYASSQSMYGVSSIDQELDEDNSEKNAVTAYARTKWEAELELKKLASPDYTVVSMRPATVFGASPRLRCDVVFNNLVACAYTTGRIEIKSDGTPWRPVVHVKDVCSAFLAGLEAPAKIVNARAYNVGIPNGNFTVADLAKAAAGAVPGSTLVFTGEHGKDSRTYRVSFTRILSELREWFRPEWTLDRGAAEMIALFKQTGFTEQQFRGRTTVRLAQLRYLISADKLDPALRWQNA